MNISFVSPSEMELLKLRQLATLLERESESSAELISNYAKIDSAQREKIAELDSLLQQITVLAWKCLDMSDTSTPYLKMHQIRQLLEAGGYTPAMRNGNG